MEDLKHITSLVEILKNTNAKLDVGNIHLEWTQGNPLAQEEISKINTDNNKNPQLPKEELSQPNTINNKTFPKNIDELLALIDNVFNDLPFGAIAALNQIHKNGKSLLSLIIDSLTNIAIDMDLYSKLKLFRLANAYVPIFIKAKSDYSSHMYSFCLHLVYNDYFVMICATEDSAELAVVDNKLETYVSVDYSRGISMMSKVEEVLKVLDRV